MGALAATGAGGALGYAAGAAQNDPEAPENNLTDIAGPAGIVLAFGGTMLALEGARAAGTLTALGGVAMLGGALIGEARDGQPY